MVIYLAKFNNEHSKMFQILEIAHSYLTNITIINVYIRNISAAWPPIASCVTSGLFLGYVHVTEKESGSLVD